MPHPLVRGQYKEMLSSQISTVSYARENLLRSAWNAGSIFREKNKFLTYRPEKTGARYGLVLIVVLLLLYLVFQIKLAQ